MRGLIPGAAISMLVWAVYTKFSGGYWPDWGLMFQFLGISIIPTWLIGFSLLKAVKLAGAEDLAGIIVGNITLVATGATWMAYIAKSPLDPGTLAIVGIISIVAGVGFFAISGFNRN